MDTPAEFLVYFEKIRGRTERVAALIPEDRIEWAPRDGKFTLGDTVRHIAAIERWMFAENAARRPSRYHGCGRELADGRDAVLVYLSEMHRESVAIFSGLSASDFDARCETPGGASIRVGKWLRSMIEHEVHHRGQLYPVPRNGNSGGGVRSAAGSAGRRRGEGDGFPRPSRGNTAGDLAPPEPKGHQRIANDLGVAPRARCYRHQLPVRDMDILRKPRARHSRYSRSEARMLGMLGVETPPLYGLTSEEVRARSVPASDVR
jgi:uncharacterized damage-inducible protein DinB